MYLGNSEPQLESALAFSDLKKSLCVHPSVEQSILEASLGRRGPARLGYVLIVLIKFNKVTI